MPPWLGAVEPVVRPPPPPPLARGAPECPVGGAGVLRRWRGMPRRWRGAPSVARGYPIGGAGCPV
eukprot:4509948-Pyramimonas_sp.AAC.1